MRQIEAYLEFIGNIGLFVTRAARRAVVPPFEWGKLWQQIEEVGWKSLPIVVPAGFALGVVLTLSTYPEQLHGLLSDHSPSNSRGLPRPRFADGELFVDRPIFYLAL
jgi:hypothetical protein